jgi:predicted Zn-dependent peptidase
MIRRTALLGGLLILALPLFAGGGNEADEYLKKHVVETTLSNGIRVQLLDRGYSPTLAMQISFNIGSADEDSESVGVAHMLEHMLFKGTPTVGSLDYPKEKRLIERIEAIGETIDYLERENPSNTRLPALREEIVSLQKEHTKYFELNPYSKIYASLGGVGFNAFTSKDMTAYVIELPSSALERWAQVEADRIQNPVFRQFYLERGAVVQERLMRYESEGQPNLIEKFGATAFIAHPYRHPVIGWESQVRYLSPRTTMRFYREHYTTDAMNITIVGRQNTTDTLKILNDTFGRIPVSYKKRRAIVREPEQSGERRVYVEFDAKPFIIIGYHKPTIPSREDYVFDVVSYILSDGKNSRLYRSLVREKKICSSVDTGNGYPGARYDNLFMITAEPREGVSVDDVEHAIYDELDSLVKTVNEAEIARVATKIRAEKIFKLDSNAALAREINYFAAVAGNWRYEIDYLDAIKSVTADEVKKAVSKYFVQSNRTVGILVMKKNGADGHDTNK